MHESYRIMIAEDEHAMATLLARLIVRIYPTAIVQTFENGLVALDAYDHAGADLLLVNHDMPGMGGPTLIRTLRVRNDTVPIIGMSGNQSYRQEYMDAGAMAFLSGEDMLGQLARLLQRFLPPLPNIQPHKSASSALQQADTQRTKIAPPPTQPMQLAPRYITLSKQQMSRLFEELRTYLSPEASSLSFRNVIKTMPERVYRHSVAVMAEQGTLEKYLQELVSEYPHNNEIQAIVHEILNPDTS